MNLPRRKGTNSLIRDKVIVEGTDQQTITAEQVGDELEIYRTSEQDSLQYVVHARSGGLIVIEHSTGEVEQKPYTVYPSSDYISEPDGMQLARLRRQAS